MTNARQGLTLIAWALVAAAPLRAQVPESSRSHSPAAEVADTGSKHGSHHHHAGGGKHDAAHVLLSFDSTTNTVTFKPSSGQPSGSRKATLVVPPKSHLVIRLVNEDSVPHRAAISGKDPAAAKLESAKAPVRKKST